MSARSLLNLIVKIAKGVIPEKTTIDVPKQGTMTIGFWVH